MNVKHKTKNIFDKALDMPIYVNIMAVLVLLCLIVFVVLKCIDIYTNHGKAVEVPDVKGKQIEDAESSFKKNTLRYEVTDSSYSKDVAPGAIVEMTPDAGSKVKKNRVINITVNAKTEKKIAVPDVVGITFRQAEALLRSRGFTDIEYKYVTGKDKNLTVGVEYGGQMVQSGTRVPVYAKLILVVSDGLESNYQEDSTRVHIDKKIEGDESWF
jgi:beta-lactam-binding protein with PASTA domain